MLLALNRRRVVPLYTEVNAQRLTESRPAHKQCPTRSLNYSCHTIQVTYIWRFITMGLKSPLGFGPLIEPPSSTLVSGFKNTCRYNPAPPGRVIPIVISPTLGPRLILTGSCQSSTLKKNLLSFTYEIFVTRHDVILWFCGNPP